MGASEEHAGGRAILDESAEDLYENAPCGYLSAAPDGRIVRVNGTFLRWTGYDRDALVGAKRFQELLTPGGRIFHDTHYGPLLQMQGVAREIALEIVAADGRRLPVLVNSRLLRGEDGAPQLIRTTVFDATERRLYERELLAARDRERVGRERIERLQQITTALAAAPDARAIAGSVTAELAAAFEAEGAGVAVSDPATGEVEVLAQHGEAEPADAARFDLAERGDRWVTVRLPLGAARTTAGWLWLAFAEARELGPQERAFLLACAGQTGLALERSRLYEEARDVAHSLQQSLLAGAPPRDARFEVATLYRPALEHLDVGGDWHDAFRLPGGRIGIVVGDVVGRGLGAASAMGQLRSAVRALAGAGVEPAGVLAHLDTFVEQIDAARYATLAYADVDPDAGEVRFASAGHPPPVLLEADGTPHVYMEGRSPPLGVTGPGMPRVQAGFALAPGAGFVLYTDGLVERRGEPLDAGFERLVAAIRASPDVSPERLAAELPRALLEGGTGDDDVCLLSFRLAVTVS